MQSWKDENKSKRKTLKGDAYDLKMGKAYQVALQIDTYSSEERKYVTLMEIVHFIFKARHIPLTELALRNSLVLLAYIIFNNVPKRANVLRTTIPFMLTSLQEILSNNNYI